MGTYYLKNRDLPLLKFTMEMTEEGFAVDITERYKEHSNLLPLDLKANEEGLLKWLKRRTIPSNRAYVVNFLAKLGLNEKDVKGIIDYCLGLSLNDCYWVTPDGFRGSFADYNLFENRFSQTLANIAFTGYGSALRSTFRSSPEFTTNGMLPKCWRRINGKIYLFKGGTSGFANSGNEPYCEFYAAEVAKRMGLEAVNYNLSKWKGQLCSTCELFTSLDYSFLPAGSLFKDSSINGFLSFLQELGEEYHEAFLDMIAFDAVILNTDRHYGNFGFLIDNKTNSIASFAPIFDNGLSLLTYAMDDELNDWHAYAATRKPALYGSFVDFAKKHIGKRQKEKLRHLIGFRLVKHPRYNFTPKRLKVLEDIIAYQVNRLLSD